MPRYTTKWRSYRDHRFLTSLHPVYWERKCADTIDTVCTADSLGWPFSMLKYEYIFQIKYTEAILSNSSRKLLWSEITKMLIAV